MCYKCVMKRLHLYLPEKTVESFKKLAAFKGIKASELYRRALEEWLEQQKRKNEGRSDADE